MAAVSITENGNSDELQLRRGVRYRLDLTASSWDAGTTVSIQTAPPSGDRWSDEVTAVDANKTVDVFGPGRARAAVSSIGTTADLQLRVEATG